MGPTGRLGLAFVFAIDTAPEPFLFAQQVSERPRPNPKQLCSRFPVSAGLGHGPADDPHGHPEPRVFPLGQHLFQVKGSAWGYPR